MKTFKNFLAQEKMTRGKYSGKTLLEILQSDFGYFCWAVTNVTPLKKEYFKEIHEMFGRNGFTYEEDAQKAKFLEWALEMNKYLLGETFVQSLIERNHIVKNAIPQIHTFGEKSLRSYVHGFLRDKLIPIQKNWPRR